MKLFQGIRDRLPVSRSTLEELQKAAKETKVELRAEVSRLEGLLDVAGDPDEALPGNQRQGLFREVLGSSARDRDMTAEVRTRVLKNSHTAYTFKGAAENLLETHLDFMLGDTLSVEAEDEKVKDFVAKIWKDERNKLEDDHEDLSRALLLEGELCLRAELSPVDGFLELAWEDPGLVKSVVQDGRRRDAFLEIQNLVGARDARIWFVLNHLSERITVSKLDKPRGESGFRYVITETTVGDDGVERVSRQKGVHALAFFFAWNRPKGGKRGRGELTSVLDSIDAGDELIWTTVDVQALKRLFLLHVKDRGITSAATGRDVLKKYGLLSPPKNPKVIGTNEKVDINFVQHKGAESEQWLAEELGIQVQGAKGFPENWRGRSDVEGSGTRSAELLPLRRLRRKQRKLIRVFETVLEVQLDFMKRAGLSVPEGAWKLETIEVGGKDKARGAEVLKNVATSLVQASSVAGVKPELVNSILVQGLREIGLEVTKDLEGLPPELADFAGQITEKIDQILSQKPKKDGEGTQDEGDRDRGEERLNRGEGARK